MSRLLLPNRFCARCTLLTSRESAWLTPRAGARLRQQSNKRTVILQQRRYFGGPNTVSSKYRTKSSRMWICGISVGVALAVGLKYRTNGSCNNIVKEPQWTDRYSAAIKASRDLVLRIQAEVGAPGLVVGVSVDGVEVWCEGIGYADLENRVPCSPDTVMRIASISKSFTSAAAARLFEEGKLDLDAPVQTYVPEFPQKQFNGQDVTITPRLILSHLSGIRHYEKDAKKVKEDKEKAMRLLKPPVKDKEDEKNSSRNKDKPSNEQNAKGKEAAQAQKKKEFEHEEYYLKDKFESVTQALDLFKDDPLIFEPGTTFLYSTHAFTLLSAVVEQAANQPFLDLMMNMFHELGMLNTVPDQNEPIIYHRSRQLFSPDFIISTREDVLSTAHM
ncbi:serine beta-lactamase-like protein LACTB, mitochondrial isoform 2-T2 [Aulostomus maculatus]